jgi:hypothetical protein
VVTRRALLGAGVVALVAAGCGAPDESEVVPSEVLGESLRLASAAAGAYEGVPGVARERTRSEARVRRLEAAVRQAGGTPEPERSFVKTGLEEALAGERRALGSYVQAVGLLSAGRVVPAHPPRPPAAPVLVPGAAVAMRVDRRDLLRAGGVALAAAALRPAPAHAADELTLLLGLWRRETGAAFAYGKVLHADPGLTLLRAHETHHAAAIATELAAIGVGTPEPPAEVSDLDIAAERLARSGPEREDVFAAAVLLEEDLVAIYQAALPALPEPKIAMTAATILASHAQHLFVLRQGSR